MNFKQIVEKYRSQGIVLSPSVTLETLNDHVRVAKQTLMSLVPYRGPKGGKGYRDTTSGKVIYGDKPGSKPKHKPMPKTQGSAPVDTQLVIAEEYADVLNIFGREVPTAIRDIVEEDLADTKYVIALQEGEWKVFPKSFQFSLPGANADDWIRQKNARNDNYHWYSPSRDRKVYTKHRPGSSKERLQARNTQVDALRGRLEKHAKGVDLTKAERGNANRFMSAMKRHHGDLALARIDELYGELAKELDTGKLTPIQKIMLRRKLAGMHHVLKDSRAEAGEEEKPKKKKPNKPKDAAKLFSVIKKRGGIDPSQIISGFGLEGLRETGLLGVTLKGGMGLDEMADILEEEGHIKVPPDRNADDYLIELLQGKAITLQDAADHYHRQAEAEYAEYIRQAEQAGIDQEDIAEATRSGEEEGNRLVAERGAEAFDELATEEGDVDFDFGANVQPEEGEGEHGEIGINPIVTNALNRVNKKKESIEQALSRLANEGIDLSRDEFEQLLKDKKQRLSSPDVKKRIRQQKAKKEKERRDREYAKQKARQERLYPEMNDSEIGQYEDHAIKLITDYLVSQGARLGKDSPGSESRYLHNPDGSKIRVSAHDLPATGERTSAADVGNEMHITVKRFMNDNELIDFVNDHFNPEPGFTGTDSLGREWRDGKLVAKQEEPTIDRPALEQELENLNREIAEDNKYALYSRKKFERREELKKLLGQDKPAGGGKEPEQSDKNRQTPLDNDRQTDKIEVGDKTQSERGDGMTRETVKVNGLGSYGSEPEFDVDLPSKAKNERGEVYQSSGGFEYIKYRLSPEQIAAFKKMGAKKVASVLEYGLPTDHNGEKVVSFSSNGKQLKMRLADKPDLQELVDNLESRRELRDKAIQEYKDDYLRKAQEKKTSTAKKLSNKFGVPVAYYIDSITGADDGWGEGTREVYHVYETPDGKKVGIGAGRAVTAEGDDWEASGAYDRPQFILVENQDTPDPTQLRDLSIQKEQQELAAKQREKELRHEQEDAKERDKLQKAQAEAVRTGQHVLVDSWTEIRRAKEGDELGDYQFIVQRFIKPDGETYQKSINTY